MGGQVYRRIDKNVKDKGYGHGGVVKIAVVCLSIVGLFSVDWHF